MAISVTEILGTDSLSGSRLVLNDNFNIVTSEINAMEVYFNPTAGTITNLNDLKTESLRVGLSTVLLDINSSTFDVLTNVNMTGNLNLNGGGLFRNDIDPQTLDDIFAGGVPYNIAIGTSTAIPPYTTERVGNSDVANIVTLSLNDGAIGQEIFFVYSQAQTGTVRITGAVTPLVLSGGNTNIDLAAQGQTVHLLCVDDGTGNGVWFIVGGDEYTLS
tara:strand:- start:18204 stop:18854 length:651 start_codon:yes stop_codon:yes gene_type:complete